MKKILCYLLMVIGVTCFLGSSLSAQTIIDQTQNLFTAWYDNGTLTYQKDVNGYTKVDHIGSAFDTKKVEISRNSGNLGFKIYTAFGGVGTVGVDVKIADFFLNFGPGKNYGVDLSYDVGGKGFWSAGLYSLGSEDYIASSTFFTGTQNLNFGGAYLDHNGVMRVANVDFNTKTAIREGDINYFSQSGSIGNFIYSFTIEQGLLTTMGLDNQAAFSFMFGTAECANDVITGVVPEPSTIVLLGLGLLGFSAVGRKKYMK